MSDRKEILRVAMLLEADFDRMERVRAYQQALMNGAELVIANARGNPVELMEAFARVLAVTVRGLPDIEKRKLLNFALRRAETHAGGGDD